MLSNRQQLPRSREILVTRKTLGVRACRRASFEFLKMLLYQRTQKIYFFSTNLIFYLSFVYLG